MRVGLISAQFPYWHQESFLAAELAQLAAHAETVVLIPASPRARINLFPDLPGTTVRLGIASAETFARAFRAARRAPLPTLLLLSEVLGRPYPMLVKLKNAMLFAKALAVADLAHELRLDHLHAYWLSTPATIAYVAARLNGIPWSSSAHRWDIYEGNLIPEKAASATFVRVISERGRRDLIARAGAHAEKIGVVRLGVTFPEHLPAPARAQREPLRILCAANFFPVKGHADLIEALALLRERGVAFHCTLAGDGPLREEISRSLRRRRLETVVEAPGAIPHATLLARLLAGEFDVSVIASIERGGGLMEGIPISLVESMAAGVACIATDSGSIAELVDETSGVLVPHSDPSALARALAELAKDPQRRLALALGGRARVAREYDIRKTGAALAALMAKGRQPLRHREPILSASSANEA